MEIEKKEPQELTAKKATKRIAKILLVTTAFVLIGSYFLYGKIPIVVFWVLLFFLPFMALSGFLGFKYRHKINSPKSKFWIVYLSIGIFMILINLAIIFTEEAMWSTYINILVGLAFVFYSIKIKNKLNK